MTAIDRLPSPPEVNLDPGFLIAQLEHGPQLHGGLLPLILVAAALLAGLVLLIRRTRRQTRSVSERDQRSDRGPEE